MLAMNIQFAHRCGHVVKKKENNSEWPIFANIFSFVIERKRAHSNDSNCDWNSLPGDSSQTRKMLNKIRKQKASTQFSWAQKQYRQQDKNIKQTKQKNRFNVVYVIAKALIPYWNKMWNDATDYVTLFNAHMGHFDYLFRTVIIDSTPPNHCARECAYSLGIGPWSAIVYCSILVISTPI